MPFGNHLECFRFRTRQLLLVSLEAFLLHPASCLYTLLHLVAPLLQGLLCRLKNRLDRNIERLMAKGVEIER